MKRLARIATLLAFAFSAWPLTSQAADCQKTGTVCVDTTPVKNISGQNITIAEIGGCWQTTDTYDCLKPGAVDYCAPLVSAGCAVTSSVCSTLAFNGDCEVYTKTYRCGNSIGNPVGTIVLADSYTLVQDTLDRSACATIEANAACTLAANICIEGPETRNIDGLDVYKDCWKYQEDYTCTAGTFANYCAPLQSAGCLETGSVCLTTAWNGDCLEYERTFNCNENPEPVPPFVTYLSSSYTIVDDTLLSTCTTYEGNPNCTFAGTSCIEGPETRNINGLDVYKDCWKTQNDYTCASTTLVSDCGELASRPECLETTAPVCVDTLPSGDCGLLEHTYECSIGTETTQTVTNCGTQTFCMDGKCFDTSFPPDKDFGTAISAMEVIREASVDNLFAGTADECASKRAFGLSNCCKNSSGGASSKNSVVASEIGSAAFSVGGEYIKVFGSEYVYNALYNSGIGIFEEYALGALCTAPVGEFGIWGAKFAIDWTGSITFVGFDPWSLAFTVAFKVLTEMAACVEEDQLTSMKRGQGLCHKVGSYCSSKFLGVCATKKESYCCFKSKLAKIIQEQGRPQIGKSWGDKKSPDCSGFQLDQLSSLDFSVMDFSEFIRTIPIPSKTPSYAIDRLNTKAASYYSTP